MNLCLCFSFGGTVQYIEESNIYLCFVAILAQGSRRKERIGYLTESASLKRTAGIV